MIHSVYFEQFYMRLHLQTMIAAALCACGFTSAAIAEELKLGLEQELEGSNLVVWLRLESVEPIEIRITPDSDDED